MAEERKPREDSSAPLASPNVSVALVVVVAGSLEGGLPWVGA